MADLWSLLEDELATQATAILGGAVDDLSIVTVLIDTVYDLDYLENHYELPVLLIVSVDADEDAGPHGDGLQHVVMSYPFHLVAVAPATVKRTAQRNAKELRRRLLAFLRNATVQAALEGVAGDDGETVQRLDYGNSGATVFGPANQDEGPYMSVAGVRFIIQTLV
jgi:hypothetical protein